MDKKSSKTHRKQNSKMEKVSLIGDYFNCKGIELSNQETLAQWIKNIKLCIVYKRLALDLKTQTG